jgi:hypothetical protein
MRAHFFTFSLIGEGTTEKIFIMPLKSIHNKFGFIKQKCIFKHYRKVKTRRNL